MRYRGEMIDNAMAKIIALNRVLAMEFWAERQAASNFNLVRANLISFLDEIRQWLPREGGDPPPPWLFDAMQEVTQLEIDRAPFMRMRLILGVVTPPRRHVPDVKPHSRQRRLSTQSSRRTGPTVGRAKALALH